MIQTKKMGGRYIQFGRRKKKGQTGIASKYA